MSKRQVHKYGEQCMINLQVSFESRFILNGVCVILRGALSRETMTGSSTLQFDEENAAAEEQRRQQAVQHYGDRIQAIRRRFNLPQSWQCRCAVYAFF